MSKKNFEQAEIEVPAPEREFRRPEGEGPTLTFWNTKNLKKGDAIEGTLDGHMENKFKADRPHFKIVLDNGDVVVVNNVGNLNFKMKNVKVGDYVRVVYEGQDIMQKGAFKGKPVNIFDVLVA